LPASIYVLASRSGYFSLAHRARAAFRADSDLCFAVIFSARAFPPLRPPFRPRATAAGSLPSSVSSSGGASPVAFATTAAASWFVSLGMRERLAMNPPYADRLLTVTDRPRQTDPLPDELVEIMSDRMRTPDDYLEVARAMEAAGRRGEANRWARRGLVSMGTRFWQTGLLREFLCSLCVADGDDQAAEELWWEDFGARPSVDSYRRLVAEARSCDPAETQDRAVGELRARTEAEDDATRVSSYAFVPVDVLLYEGQADEAWQVANRHGSVNRPG
jgi:hypothetical protein